MERNESGVLERSSVRTGGGEDTMSSSMGASGGGGGEDSPLSSSLSGPNRYS